MKFVATVFVIALAATTLDGACLSTSEIQAEPSGDDSAPTSESEKGAEPTDPKLLEAFELINRSTDLMGWDQPNPVALVRAVNHLHSLGKERAIETLREYVRYAPVHGDRDKLHSADQQRLCWIIPLLFVAADDRVRLPSLGRDPRRWSRGEWDELAISVQGELPFHDSAANGRTGVPDPGRGYLVEWAAVHGQLRDEPLRPLNDPLLAADELCKTIIDDNKKHSNGYKEMLRSHLRLQARRTIEHLFPVGEKKEWNYDKLSDRNWQTLKEAAGKLKIRWDEKEQKYVAG